jgi:hypothetical protein
VLIWQTPEPPLSIEDEQAALKKSQNREGVHPL